MAIRPVKTNASGDSRRRAREEYDPSSFRQTIKEAIARPSSWLVSLLVHLAALLILGLIVVFNLYEATYVLLGVLLGVQALVDGITLLVLGRWRVTDNSVQVVATV